jgi:hypothetical protein
MKTVRIQQVSGARPKYPGAAPRPIALSYPNYPEVSGVKSTN